MFRLEAQANAVAFLNKSLHKWTDEQVGILHMTFLSFVYVMRLCFPEIHSVLDTTQKHEL